MAIVECLVIPISVAVAAAIVYLVFIRGRCPQCKRLFVRDSGKERIPQLRWYEQGRDTADTLTDSLTTTLAAGTTPDSKKGGSYEVCTTVYVMVAEWLRCKHCGKVAVAALPEIVRIYRDYPWDAGKRAEQLQAEGVASMPPPAANVNHQLDRLRNRLQKRQD